MSNEPKGVGTYMKLLAEYRELERKARKDLKAMRSGGPGPEREERDPLTRIVERIKIAVVVLSVLLVIDTRWRWGKNEDQWAKLAKDQQVVIYELIGRIKSIHDSANP